MKLNLQESNGIFVLSVLEKINGENFKILRAGMIRLLKAGKNKILLDLQQTEGIEHEVIHELAVLNVTAHEHAGEVALSGLTEALRLMIQNAAKPPVIPHFKTKEEAFAFFRQLTPASAGPPSAGAPQAPSEHENLIREINTLKEENAMLKKEKGILQKQFKEMIIQRRVPPNEPTYKEKIAMLEKRIGELTASGGQKPQAATDKPPAADKPK